MSAERVETLLAVARRIADPDDALGREARTRLNAIAPLSPEGIELALREHLETQPTREELERLLAWAEPAAACSILLSANVCTAALRAMALGVTVAPRVRVRPSRRDPVLAEILAREAARRGLDVATTETLEPAPAMHLYGSDETLAAIALPETGVRRFGAGFGVAVCRHPSEAEAVARDLVAFDGAGCLSPRIVAAPVDGPERIARALHEALSSWGERVPRFALTAPDRAALRRAQATYAAIGAFLEGPHHAVACDPTPRSIDLLPPLRAALVVAADTTTLFEPVRHAITCIGGEGPLAEALHAMTRVRRAPLGAMQKPPLDGPVDLRCAAALRRLGP